ncbi:MAG: glycosyltransferase family 39 protein [Anaerolineae bacterium]
MLYRGPWLLALISCLLAFALRLHRLGDQNVWWDEGYSIWVARQGLWQGALATAHDVHPPLYYWLLHFWRLAAGDNEWTLRFLSLLLGVLTVALTYRLGHDLGWPTAGAVAALFVTVSRFCIIWSQEMRMYTLATVLGLASILLAVRLWQHGHGLWCYALVSAALMHTLYLGVVFLVVQNALWLLWLLGRSGTWWRRWLVAQVVTALLTLPWLGLFLPRMRSWSVAEPIGLGRFLYYYWGVLTTGTTVNIERHWLQMLVLGLVFVAALLGVLVGAWRHRAPITASASRAVAGMSSPSLLAIAALLPPLLVFALAQPHSFFYSPRPEPRYLNPFAAFVYLLWAVGLVAAWRWCQAIGLSLALVSLGGLALPLLTHYQSRYLEDDYRSIACTLATYAQLRDLVLLHTDSDWPVFAYHYHGSWQGVPNNVAWDETSASGFLGQYLPARQVAWLVLTTDAIRADPQMAIEERLEQWCHERECYEQEWRFGERRLVRFGRGLSLTEPSPAAARHVPGMPGVLGAWWPYQRGRSASLWQVYVWWKEQQGSPPELALYRDGAEVAAAEASVEGDGSGYLARLAYQLFLPTPGEYSVRLHRGSEAATLTALKVGAPPMTEAHAATGQRQVVHAVFGDKVMLEGFALSGQVAQPAKQLCVTLFWRAEAPVEQPYAVFVHLLGQAYNAGQDNFLWGQHDGQPVEGLRPLPSWQLGELIEDGHCFVVDPQAPPGVYLIEVGLYDRSSGRRLPVTAGGEGDRVILTEMWVE